MNFICPGRVGRKGLKSVMKMLEILSDKRLLQGAREALVLRAAGRPRGDFGAVMKSYFPEGWRGMASLLGTENGRMAVYAAVFRHYGIDLNRKKVDFFALRALLLGLPAGDPVREALRGSGVGYGGAAERLFEILASEGGRKHVQNRADGDVSRV